MFKVQVIAYPWDLEDEGIDRVLDTLQGEVGVQGLSVVAASEPVCELRARPEAIPRVFRSRGGLYFHPGGECYSDTRLKPVTSRWLKSRDPIARVAETCRERNIGLRLIVQTRRIGRLAEKNPTLVAKSVFGDESTAALCPINPDVRAFFCDLVADVCRQYSPEAVEIHDMDRPFETAVLSSAADRYALGPAGEALFSICFCESCRQWASENGADAEGAARSADVTLGKAIESGQALIGTLDDLIAADEILGAYVESLRVGHAEVVDAMARAASRDVALRVTAQADRHCGRLSRLVRECQAIVADAEIPLSEAHDDPLTLAHDIAATRDDLHCDARIPAREATFGDPPIAVQTLRLLVDRGVAGAHLDHYGVMGAVELNAAKQAVRYARRVADI
jgi:hypothetical protein